MNWVQAEVDQLGVETDGKGWRDKSIFTALKLDVLRRTGWFRCYHGVISNDYPVIAELVPDPVNKRYDIQIRTGVSATEMQTAKTGTVGREGKYGEAVHVRIGWMDWNTRPRSRRYVVTTKTRRDYRQSFAALGEARLQASPGRSFAGATLLLSSGCGRRARQREEYEFRSVTEDDLDRERIVRGSSGEPFGRLASQGLGAGHAN